MTAGGHALRDIRRHATLDSTNEEARRLALAGERGPLWIVAGEQTQGRGRRGRSWVSERGNLFATLLTPCTRTLESCAQLSFAAALAAGDAVQEAAPGASVLLKWPNDVLVNGRKAAGVLLEAGSTHGSQWVAVGIGINLVSYPARTDFPATSLAEAGIETGAGDMLNRLAEAWERWFAAWDVSGFKPLRDAWLARAAGLRDKVTARIGETEMHGVFEDLDLDGALLLRRDGGETLRITAGDIYVRA